MAKRLFIAIALVWMATVSPQGAPAVASKCNSTPCAEYWEFCQETAEYWGGEYLECCTGFCMGPHPGIDCNNDSNQCRCVELD